MKHKICFLLVLVLLCAQLLAVPAFAEEMPGDTVVYTTTYGECYHRKGCGSLWNSQHETTLATAVRRGYRPCGRCNPGILSNAEREAIAKSEKSKEIMLFVCIFAGPIAIFSVYLCVFSVQAKMEDKKKMKVFLEEKAGFEKQYGGKKPEDLAGMPSWVEIGPDGLPRTIGSEQWGDSFTFYVTLSGQAFHQTKGCSGATFEINAAQIGWRHPCGRCSPVAPNLDWYWKYKRIKEIKEKYNID